MFELFLNYGRRGRKSDRLVQKAKDCLPALATPPSKLIAKVNVEFCSDVPHPHKKTDVT